MGVKPRAAAGPEGMSWLQRVIEKWYPTQPGWARTAVFLGFALLLGAFLYKSVAGTHVVQAHVLERVGDALQPVRNKEVRLYGYDVGTNFNGIAYIPLSSPDYYALLAAGEIKVDLVDATAERAVRPMRAKFNRWTNELADFTALQERGEAGRVDKSELPDFRGPDSGSALAMVLIPAAHALDETSTSRYRLFVNWIQLSKSFRDANQGTFQLVVNGTGQRLRDARTGRVAENVPIAPGEKLLLGDTMYFNVPASAGASSVVVETSRFFGFNSKETFAASLASLKPGQHTVLASGGHKIGVTLMHAYDVTLFGKADLNAEALQKALATKGYRAVVKPSPLGSKRDTNAVFLGKSVPFETAQELVNELVSQKIKLKVVVCDVPLRSGNPREIQVGAWADYDSKPVLPPARLAAMRTAQSGAQFCAAGRQ